MNSSKFKEFFEEGWFTKLQPFIESTECDKIYKFLKEEANRGKTICPYSKDTFRVFKETPYNDLKIIWLLQDPYPFFKGDMMVADGIAMSCSYTKTLQPSLRLFYDGLELDVGLQLEAYRNPDLSFLCHQGILMLNTALTVERGQPESHEDIWRPFMRYLFEEVINQYNSGLIIVLAGKSSERIERYINPLHHHIIKVEHPARAAHEFRPWDHQGVFTKINKLSREYYNFTPSWMEELPF